MAWDTTSEPLLFLLIVPSDLTIVVQKFLLQLDEACIRRRVYLAGEPRRPLFCRYHILGDIWQQVALSVTLACRTIHLQVELATFELCRIDRVLT